MQQEDHMDARAREREILSRVLAAFEELDDEARVRVLQTVGTFFGINVLQSVGAPRNAIQSTARAPSAVQSSFSEDRSISPKQFMLEKGPRTDVERVACLAYYLTHYRETPHFKTIDISKVNTEAAQAKFSNAAVALNNATKMNYLVPATKGNKQLSALGEQFVLALPDRDKARAVMVHARPRRKQRKTADSLASEI